MVRAYKVLCVAVAVMASALVSADSITVSWESAPGSDGYRIYQSVDSGATWTVAASPVTPPTILEVPGDKLVLLRVSAVKGERESVNESRGAWYYGALRGWPVALAVR